MHPSIVSHGGADVATSHPGEGEILKPRGFLEPSSLARFVGTISQGNDLLKDHVVAAGNGSRTMTCARH
jgi:hypothetical protein